MRYLTALMMLILFIGLLSCEKKVEEKQPVASFTVDPTTGPFTTVFNYDATKTHMDGEAIENLLVRWDWEGDGIFDTEYSTTKLMNYQYECVGNYNVVMEVINPIGWTDTEIFPIVVFADSVPPVAAIRAIPDSSSVSTIFYFSAGDSFDPHSPIQDLMFRWDWQGDGFWDTPYSSDTSTYHKYDSPGNYRIHVEVKNNVLLTDTISQIIYVYEI
jgi:PKD repeat protein